MPEPVRICIEAGSRRVFASALDWPGWCRQARTEASAIKELEACAPRYRPVARAAGVTFPTEFKFEVVETSTGNATTDFGAPGIVAKAESEPLDLNGAKRLSSLVKGVWVVLETVASNAPAGLRKGPRGGGRDTAQMIEHVHAAEDAYLRKVGIKLKDPSLRRLAFLAALESVEELEGGWPLRYAVRRTAWHALDHAWEIEERSS